MPEGRFVRRVVRKVDVGSVLRLSVVFWACLTLVTVLAGMVVWAAAGDLGALTSMSKFMESLGIVNFRFHGTAILRAAILLGLAFVAVASVFSVMLAVLYNSVSAMVGGVELVFAEAEWAQRPAAAVAATGSAVVTRSPKHDDVAATERAEPLSPGGVAVS